MVYMAIGGCTDSFLDQEPTSSISDNQVFDKYVTAEAALVGAYDQLSSYNFDGLYIPIYSDIIGEDIMVNSVDNWNWFVPVYQLNMLPNYVYSESPWWAGYKLIYDVNNIIAKTREIPDATLEQKNSLEGQARVIRAYAYLKLIQMYAPSFKEDPNAPGILLVTEPLGPYDEDVSRSTILEVYNQITNDLTVAITLLENTSDKGFFDKRAAQAILARTYLNMEEWSLARDMAKQAYEGISLMSVDDLFGGFHSRNSETIFSIAYTEEDNNVYLSIPSFYWPVGGYSSMRANDKFVNLFSSNDYRKGFFLRYDEIDPNRHIIVKFSHNNAVGNAERVAIRASEMYLIEAECEAELANYQNAQNALYVVQARANPAIAKSQLTGQALIDEILIERRRELFGEGFRWNDIKRRLNSFVREGDHWVNFNFSSIDDDYYRLTYPIPQSEIDANSVLSQSDQNRGY